MTLDKPVLQTPTFRLLLVLGVLANLSGLPVPILEPDGALYACLSKTMVQTHDWVGLYAVGADWLDKPHFPFWMGAISFRIFGINAFAYKLPAVLFFLMGVAYTYRFALITYGRAVAQVAALVLLTTFHSILSNTDVRAEPYLTGLIIGAVYHYYRLYRGGPRWHLGLGALLTACALMTKGLFVLVPIGAGLLLHWLLTGHWRELLRPRWYVAVGLSLVFTLPELYVLYRQFDLHPEKMVFGQTGVSGVRFFFWDSQFGRFFNTGPIKGEGDKLFFVHTLLWAFLPWSLPLYVSVGKALVGVFKRQHPLPEYVSLGAGLATFGLFSLSGFQLPHYLNPVFPFFAILTAQFLVNLPASAARTPGVSVWNRVQTAIGYLIGVLAVWLMVVVYPNGLVWAFVWIGVCMAVYAFGFRGAALPVLMSRMAVVMLMLAVVLNGWLYPTLMRYQAGMMAARYVNSLPDAPIRPTVLYLPGTGPGGGSFWTYEFYVKSPVQHARTEATLRQLIAAKPEHQRLWTTVEQADSLERRGFVLRKKQFFPYYHISQLTYTFLNRDTRPQSLDAYVLADVSAEK